MRGGPKVLGRKRELAEDSSGSGGAGPARRPALHPGRLPWAVAAEAPWTRIFSPFTKVTQKLKMEFFSCVYG